MAVVKCRLLQPLADGQIKFVRTTSHNEFGAVATYRCKKGYELDGARVLRCAGNGRWSEVQPVCYSKLNNRVI